MADLDANLARIYGSDDDQIFTAPLGTALPEEFADLAAGFIPFGWLGSDGITETLTGSPTEIRGHQGNGVVRKRIESPGTQFSFVALQTDEQSLSTRYHEKSVTSAAGVRSAVRGAGQKVRAVVAVIDLFDADDITQRERFVIPRFEIVPNGDRTYINNDISSFPFLGEVIGDYFHYSTVPVTP